MKRKIILQSLFVMALVLLGTQFVQASEVTESISPDGTALQSSLSNLAFISSSEKTSAVDLSQAPEQPTTPAPAPASTPANGDTLPWMVLLTLDALAIGIYLYIGLPARERKMILSIQ